MASGFYRVISVSCFLIRSFFRTLVVVGFICVLLAGTIQTTQGATTTSATSTAGDIKHAGGAPVGKGNLVHPAELDLNYMSKRRVPNGPDPIHNRRRPPGQA